MVKSLSGLCIKVQVLKDAITERAKVSTENFCLKEPFKEIFFLCPSWVMTLFSQFRRMMKWNSNCNSNCSEGKKDRSRIAISKQHLGTLGRLELSQWSSSKTKP